MRVGRLLGNLYSKRVAQGTALAVLALGAGALSRQAAKPTYVDITWMSVTNMYYELGDQRILTDGYITRLPKDAFFGGGSGAAQTNRRFAPDTASVKRVLAALGGPSSVNLLLTGHSHFDHSFDTGLWSALTGAKVIGSKTTCFQVEAQRIPANRCTAVNGGERIVLGDGVTMYVVRFNHSGDPAKNPDLHNAVELDAPPRPDANGGLRAGLAEDFPNGGGNRAYLFVVDGAERERPLQLVLQQFGEPGRPRRPDRRGRTRLRCADRKPEGRTRRGEGSIGGPVDRRGGRADRGAAGAGTPSARLHAGALGRPLGPVHRWRDAFIRGLRRGADPGGLQCATDQTPTVHGQMATRPYRCTVSRQCPCQASARLLSALLFAQ